MNKEIIIAVVDDDEIHQFGMRKDLNTLEFPIRILFFLNGKEAIEYIYENLTQHENLPHIIFLDINMPIMDGFGFIEGYKKVRNRMNRAVVIYMVTSSIDSIDISKAESISEIADYLIKPVELSELSNLVRHLRNNIQDINHT